MHTFSKPVLLITSLTMILAVLLSACGSAVPPAPTADVNVIYTQAAATIVGGITQTAAAMPSATPVPPSATPEPSATPAPSATPDAALQPTATQPPAAAAGSSATPIVADPATAFGCYNASFVAHVTLPYAPAFNPGDKFTKTWRVKNTGSCDWPRGFKITFISGDRFGADTMEIGQKVLTGATTEISLLMTAPNLAGVVSSNWQLTTDIGKPFGQVLSTSITLPGTAGATSGEGCLNSALVSDVSVSSGAEFKTGENFTKTWLIKNTGTCAWNRDFKITFVGGDMLGSDTKKIRQDVGPGASTEISLAMTAPGTAGTYSSSWQMASDTGTLFGQSFTFSIVAK